jgi:hypothetical protein
MLLVGHLSVSKESAPVVVSLASHRHLVLSASSARSLVATISLSQSSFYKHPVLKASSTVNTFCLQHPQLPAWFSATILWPRSLLCTSRPVSIRCCEASCDVGTLCCEHSLRCQSTSWVCLVRKGWLDRYGKGPTVYKLLQYLPGNLFCVINSCILS